MCEHLLCFYSMTADRTALCEGGFPVYFSGYGEADLILFGLADKREDGSRAVRELLELQIDELNIVSPEPLEGFANIETQYVDWDYHVDVEGFDLSLKGGRYEALRYRVKQAERKSYSSRISREFTRSHAYVLSRHAARHTLDVWDYEELLSLERFFRDHDHGFMLEAYRGDRLIGFDVVDFFEDNKTMVVPLGVYLEEPSLADFLTYEDLRYAKENGYRWLDVGLACRSTGLEEFKRKWFAEPKHRLCVQTIRSADHASLRAHASQHATGK